MLVTPLRTIRNRQATLEEIGMQARETRPVLQKLETGVKNGVLTQAASRLLEKADFLLESNRLDVETAVASGMNPGLVDRLTLTSERIAGMAEGLRQLAGLEDPIGEVLSMKKRPNGLLIGQKRVPLGVVGIIYEARPNVTADAFGLCFKTGNAVILKGGSDALHSNQAIVELLQEVLVENGLPEDCIQLIGSTDRAVTTAFMRLNQYVDVLIPRGSARLIRAVVENSTIPVIETGTGNCHIYVDESADLEMAVNIIFNAKTQRIGVCNACESLVVHEKVIDALLPALKRRLDEKQVELRGDKRASEAAEGIIPATEEDWGTEYLDYILSIKTVSSLDEAIAHINRYNTGHSEAIITESYTNAQRFLEEIDAAAVYVNASTRFTDGFEFGFGAEIGISTQKLHARGPMGLLALTTTKYIIYGNGQVRP
ncbi:MAG: glutamate-5-semialdehyde dehydrogenase [Candidatus Limivivens sp.]|nr:glutamate-5-semialdehyde dehydrogenase [Candidatus Limivivens sp.]